MSRIAILCPTKARPELFQRLWQKTMETTDSRVTILAYREDQDYAGYPPLENVKYRIGNLWTVNEGMNALVQENRDFDIYGMIPDDAYPTIKDWDLYLDEVMDITKARALMTPHDGEWADMAFVTKPWISGVGYYAAPFAAHYVWPTVIDILAESTQKRIEPDPRGSWSITTTWREEGLTTRRTPSASSSGAGTRGPRSSPDSGNCRDRAPLPHQAAGGVLVDGRIGAGDHQRPSPRVCLCRHGRS